MVGPISRLKLTKITFNLLSRISCVNLETIDRPVHLHVRMSDVE